MQFFYFLFVTQFCGSGHDAQIRIFATHDMRRRFENTIVIIGNFAGKIRSWFCFVAIDGGEFAHGNGWCADRREAGRRRAGPAGGFTGNGAGHYVHVFAQLFESLVVLSSTTS